MLVSTAVVLSSSHPARHDFPLVLLCVKSCAPGAPGMENFSFNFFGAVGSQANSDPVAYTSSTEEGVTAEEVPQQQGLKVSLHACLAFDILYVQSNNSSTAMCLPGCMRACRWSMSQHL
jgi:hypothetical protein